jgi:hypothetical protein
VIKPAGFDGADEVGECGIEGVEGFIHHRALVAFCCCGVPELHASIVLESVFDNRLFLKKIRKVSDPQPAPNRPTDPRQDPLSPIPLPTPAIISLRRPELGSRLAAGHPQGLALTPTRTTPHCHCREQGVAEPTRSRATKIIRNDDQDQPPSAVVPYSGLPVGSYDNITAPLPKVLDSTSRRAVGTVPSLNNRLPPPSRTG